MIVARTVRETREALAGAECVALVPTMGALHAGHMALVARARELAPLVVVSIFVNPRQFGPNEDFEAYPRSESADLAACESAGVGVVFVPSVREMYPEGHATTVSVSGLTAALCGARRPGHFDGVTTVVLKLFNVVRPRYAVFGLKDAQQFYVVRRLARDADTGVEVVPVPTVREPDGLAVSSRNAYLTPEERRVAPNLYEGLKRAEALFESGERRARRLIDAAYEHVAEHMPTATVDYMDVVDVERVEPVVEVTAPSFIAAAVFLGRARLIDNVHLGGRLHECFT